jgi:hypothetical protein
VLRGNFFPGGPEVSAQGGFHGGDGELVDAEGAEERMTANFGDEILFAGDDADLRAAEKLVAAEENEREAGFNAFAGGGFVNAEGREVDEAAGAEVFDDRQRAARAERDQLCHFRFFGEAGHREIGGMDAKKQAGFFGDGVFVVGDASAVGGTDFAEDGATLLHDFGDAKAVADFDELAAGDDDFAATSECRKSDKDGSGAVVHNDSGFGASEALDQERKMNVALAAGAGGEIVLEIGITRGGLAELFEGRRSERGAAEIGVEDDAGSVDDGAERGREFGVDGCGDAVFDRGGSERRFIGDSAGNNFAAELGENFADSGDSVVAIDGVAERGDAREEKHFINGRKKAEKSGLTGGRRSFGGNRHGAISSQAMSGRNWGCGCSGPGDVAIGTVRCTEARLALRFDGRSSRLTWAGSAPRMGFWGWGFERTEFRGYPGNGHH